jgi:outer membrane protein TolC
VSLNLTAFLARDSEPEALDWTSLLRLRVPFFEAGLVEAEIRDALSRLREARLFDARVRRAVARDVAVARASFVAVGRRVLALDVRLDAARRAFDLAEGQWRAGLATNLERLTAQDELLAVELELAGADLERRIRLLELRRAEGLVRAEAGLPPEPEDRARPR